MTTTARFGLTKPDIGGTNWGTVLNTAWDGIDNAAGVALANTFTQANTFNNTVAINNTSATALVVSGSVNGSNPRITSKNNNGTSGQQRTSLIVASGDNGNVECSIQAGKDASNNSIQMVSGTSFLQLGVGGIEYAKITTAGIVFTSTSAQGVVGSTTNDSAAAGNVGEYFESVVTSVASSGSSTQYSDIASLSLTAGDWSVTGQVTFVLNGATVTDCLGAISTTTGNSSTGIQNGKSQMETLAPTAAANTSVTMSGVRFSLSGNATVYLKSNLTFSAGTPKVFGSIWARRVR